MLIRSALVFLRWGFVMRALELRSSSQLPSPASAQSLRWPSLRLRRPRLLCASVQASHPWLKACIQKSLMDRTVLNCLNWSPCPAHKYPIALRSAIFRMIREPTCRAVRMMLIEARALAFLRPPRLRLGPQSVPRALGLWLRLFVLEVARLRWPRWRQSPRQSPGALAPQRLLCTQKYYRTSRTAHDSLALLSCLRARMRKYPAVSNKGACTVEAAVRSLTQEQRHRWRRRLRLPVLRLRQPFLDPRPWLLALRPWLLLCSRVFPPRLLIRIILWPILLLALAGMRSSPAGPTWRRILAQESLTLFG